MRDAPRLVHFRRAESRDAGVGSEERPAKPEKISRRRVGELHRGQFCEPVRVEKTARSCAERRLNGKSLMDEGLETGATVALARRCSREAREGLGTRRALAKPPRRKVTPRGFSKEAAAGAFGSRCGRDAARRRGEILRPQVSLVEGRAAFARPHGRPWRETALVSKGRSPVGGKGRRPGASSLEPGSRKHRPAFFHRRQLDWAFLSYIQ